MDWLVDELEKRLDEKADTGSLHQFVVRVRIDGTTMKTAVWAENKSRAKKLANHQFGAANVISEPTKS